MPSNKDVRWIDNIEKLHGIKIASKDLVIYGFKFGDFGLDIQKKLKTEIQLRQAK